jgi:hypothetical protein
MSEQIKFTSNYNVPDEPQLEEMLSHFKPQPSIRFYDKIKNAPWLFVPTENKKKLVFQMSLTNSVVLGISILLLILALLGITFIPSVRAAARQIIYSFINAPSNQIEVQATLQNSEDLFNFSNPVNFQLTIQEAQQAAGFMVMEISSLPDDLLLIGSRYDPNYSAVTILYQAHDYLLFLTQRPIGNGEDVFSIGPDAQIDLVKIGNQQGEFVVGGWKAITVSKTPDSSEQTTIKALWDDDLPQYTLRWQYDGFSYELRSLGEGSPSQSELINLANEIK